MKKDTCKFYNGDFRNTHCLAGVCYRDVTTDPDNNTGSAFRKPCIDWEAFDRTRGMQPMSPAQRKEWDRRGTCDKRQVPTAEEIAAYETKVKLSVAKFMAAGPLIARIKKEHRGKSWKGVDVCPVCNGRLHMTHAAVNGHVWGQCETKDCLSWVE